MRSTPRFLVLLLIIYVSFGTAVRVVAADSNEPNNDLSTATPIAIVCDGSSVELVDADIGSLGDVDYYKIDLLAGQVLTIDVDAEIISSSLDSMLEVFDGGGILVGADDDSPAPGEDSLVDPYLEFTAAADGTYYVAVSASSTASARIGDDDAGDDGAAFVPGSYTVSFVCSAQSEPPVPVDPVIPGDLLGATGSESGSLIGIIPGTGESTFRYSLGTIGPITEIEFSSDGILLFGATAVPTAGGSGSIITIDPNTGAETLVGVVQVIEIDPDGNVIPTDVEASGAVIALELVEGTLYGIYLGNNNSNFSELVIVDQSTGAMTIVGSTGFGKVDGLAYDAAAQTMYGACGTELISIDLETGAGTRVASIDLSQPISALEFNGEGTLFAATVGLYAEEAKLFTIALTTDPDTGAVTATATEVVPITGTAASSPAGELPVGLAFVPGEEAPPADCIKTICSSALTSPTLASSAFASSEPTKSKFTKRSQLANNPLHRAIGLFKFEGMAGEAITITLRPEEEQEETTDESPIEGLNNWLSEYYVKRKGRAYLGVRDTIPDVEFRVKRKGSLPLVIGGEDEAIELPANGWYYIMVMQPLPRLFRKDYCLEVKSDDQDSLAWQTLKVAWPTDSSAEETSKTSEEASPPEPQNVAAAVEEPAGDDGVNDETESVNTTTDNTSGNTTDETSTDVIDGPADGVTDEPTNDESHENDRLTVEKSTGDDAGESETIITTEETPNDTAEEETSSDATEEPAGDAGEPESVITTDDTSVNTPEETPAGVTEEPETVITTEETPSNTAEETSSGVTEEPADNVTDEPENLTVEEPAGEQDVQSEIQ